QGGDDRVVGELQRLTQLRSYVEVVSSKAGFVVATKCEQFGTALAMFGGGREKKEDKIDHAVGLEFHKRIGDRVERNEKLVIIHSNSDAKLPEARTLIVDSYVIGDQVPKEKRLLVRRILGA